MHGWVESVLATSDFVSHWLSVANNDLIRGDTSNDWNTVLMFSKSSCCSGQFHMLHTSKCLLGLDVPGVTKVWSGLVFIAISGCFILHWVVFDLAKGFNTLVDFTERLFLGVLVLCLRKFSCDTSSEGLSSPMSISYCPAVIREEVWVWASFVGLTTTYNTKNFLSKFSETWPVDLLLLSSHSVPLR